MQNNSSSAGIQFLMKLLRSLSPSEMWSIFIFLKLGSLIFKKARSVKRDFWSAIVLETSKLSLCVLGI